MNPKFTSLLPINLNWGIIKQDLPLSRWKKNIWGVVMVMGQPGILWWFVFFGDDLVGPSPRFKVSKTVSFFSYFFFWRRKLERRMQIPIPTPLRLFVFVEREITWPNVCVDGQWSIPPKFQWYFFISREGHVVRVHLLYVYIYIYIHTYIGLFPFPVTVENEGLLD